MSEQRKKTRIIGLATTMAVQDPRSPQAPRRNGFDASKYGIVRDGGIIRVTCEGSKHVLNVGIGMCAWVEEEVE